MISNNGLKKLENEGLRQSIRFNIEERLRDIIGMIVESDGQGREDLLRYMENLIYSTERMGHPMDVYRTLQEKLRKDPHRIKDLYHRSGSPDDFMEMFRSGS